MYVAVTFFLPLQQSYLILDLVYAHNLIINLDKLIQGCLANNVYIYALVAYLLLPFPFPLLEETDASSILQVSGSAAPPFPPPLDETGLTSQNIRGESGIPSAL